MIISSNNQLILEIILQEVLLPYIIKYTKIKLKQIF